MMTTKRECTATEENAMTMTTPRIGLYRIQTYTNPETGGRRVKHSLSINGKIRASVSYDVGGGRQQDQPGDTWGQVIGAPLVESQPHRRFGQVGTRTWPCIPADYFA